MERILGGEDRTKPVVGVKRIFEMAGPFSVEVAGTWREHLRGWRIGRTCFARGVGLSLEEVIQTVHRAGRDAGLGEIPEPLRRAMTVLMTVAHQALETIGIEISGPAEGTGVVIRVAASLNAPQEDLLPSVLHALGEDGLYSERMVAWGRLKTLQLDWAFGQPIQVYVALTTKPRQPEVIYLAATTPLGIRLLPICAEMRYEMKLRQAHRGMFLFRLASGTVLQEAIGDLDSPLVECLQRVTTALGRGSSGLSVVPGWVGLGLSGRRLEPWSGEVRFQMEDRFG